jgi:type IV pilus assembly protein PilY1
MNYIISTAFKLLWRTVLACTLLAPALPTWAQTSPFAATPLLSAGSNVKPNLMLLMDNSGSMDFTHSPDGYRAAFANGLTPLNAYQSPDANKIYYNPRIRYAPSVSAAGTPTANATAATARADLVIWAKNNSGNVGANDVFYREACDAASCSSYLGGAYRGSFGTFGNTTNTLTFNLCSAWTAGVCTAINTYNIPAATGTFNTTPYLTLTTSELSTLRTDCVDLPGRCSWREERQNALNWQLYYSNRMKATKTSIAIAFADPKYDNAFRLGYGWMNQNNGTNAQGDAAGEQAEASKIRRGVRPFTDRTTTAIQNEKTQFYTWLNGLQSSGGTWVHSLLNAAGKYYEKTGDGGPWGTTPANDPNGSSSDNSTQLSCRRSNAVMFSDGAYTDPSTAFTTPNVDGTAPSTITTGQTFTYSITPSTTATYIAYPDTTANTVADLAASYWLRDLRTDDTNMPDNISTVDGNPAFWQHMVFYTIGFGIKGTVSPADIAQYNSNFTRGIASTLNWTGGTTDENKINDYIHAGYAGRGGSYSVATPSDVQNAFDDVISRTIQQAGADAGVAVSDTNSDLSTLAGELKYVPSYSLLESTGDIKAYTLSANGNVSGTTPVWFASRSIPGVATRTLVTSSGTGTAVVGVNLTTPFSSLNADVRTSLGSNANDSFISYLRGATTGINAAGQNLRIRNSLMGTVVNSPPTYVRGELEMGYTTTFVSTTFTGIDLYAAYKKAKTENSAGVLFAAANEGILHAMNPQKGNEIMGFIPRSVMPKLNAFSLEPYAHQYLLDGPITEGDIYSSGATAWKSMAFGTGGRGGQYVFALNVPVKATATGTLTSPVMTASDVKWEISKDTSSNFANLGYVLNGVQTGYLTGGRWVAVFGNGYYSSTGVASLFIVDALTGAFIQEISTGIGSTASPNGMGGITLVRSSSREIVAAIGGDSKGNMWKFDLRAAGTGAGKVAFGGSPLYTVPGNRPFSGAPAWRPVNGGMLVVAATGLLNTKADSTDTGTQTIYGILDKTAVGGDETTTFTALGTLTPSMLQLQTTGLVVSTSTSVASYYNVSKNAVDYSTKKGWQLDLTFEAGQRSVADVLNIGHTVVISTVVPPSSTSTAESCTAGTAVLGYVYQLDALTGGNPDIAGYSSGRSSGFDINGDGIGDGYGVAKAPGFPRGNVIARDSIGPRTESVLYKDGNVPCDGTSTGGALLGTGGSALALVSTCGGGGYRRTWRQLINPPRIN